MKLSPLLVFFASLAVINASAVVIDVGLPFKEIRLKNGTLFSEVTVKSVNTSSQTAMLVGKREMHSIPTYLLPDEINDKLKALMPTLSKDQPVDPITVANEKMVALERTDKQRRAETDARAVREAARQSNLRAAAMAEARENNLISAVAKAAEHRARDYFTHEDDPHSNIGYVTNVDLTMGDPETVPGWAGRYRVTGTAYRQYLNNQSSGFGRTTKKFEVLVDTSDDGKVKVSDLTIRM